jgi:hypothetical protein
VFYTQAVNRGGDRCNPEHARRILSKIHEDMLPDVDKPRLRSATRMGTLLSCLTRTQEALRRMTKDVPAEYPSAETVAELQDMEAFLTHTMALYRNDTPDSIDEVRAAVRAWLTLNNPKNN